MDALEVIDKAIAQHRIIREQVKQVGEAVNDVEALFSLQKVNAVWSQSSIGELGDKKEYLARAISTLEESLKTHFGFEERNLPPVLGENLTKWLLFEHQQIRQQISTTKTAIAGTELKGLQTEEILARKTAIQQKISDLRQGVEEHAGHEEVIFNMIKKALDHERQQLAK